jgi:hypothetical protein
VFFGKAALRPRAAWDLEADQREEEEEEEEEG